MDAFWAILWILVGVMSWILNFVGLPGNWFLVGSAALYAYIGPQVGRPAIDWRIVVALAVLALLGEIIELVAGAVGVKRAGGSRRGALLALCGSILGGLVGMFVGIPIPVIGQLVAAVLFAGLGALTGAVLGERWKGRDLDQSWRVGEAAFWSRLLGTLGKAIVGAVMLALAVAAVIL